MATSNDRAPREKAVLQAIAPLFADWPETMIWSCLQGHLGRAEAEGTRSAMLSVGAFCFFAGEPCVSLAARADQPILAARTADWFPVIEAAWGERVRRYERYATRKDPEAFDDACLRTLAAAPAGFTLTPFDARAYEAARAARWSADLCALFPTYAAYAAHGIGVVAWQGGRLVAGASSYTYYDGGIEIEIDTNPEFRRCGLATACGAALILACRARGLYPSWDAHDRRSLALAEKLGYRLDRPYPVYLKDWPEDD